MREKLNEIIFGTTTRAGRNFDLILLLIIFLSVITLMLESMPAIRKYHHTTLITIEWVFTGIFTLEYVLRIWVSKKPLLYIKSWWGIIDLLSLLPTFLIPFVSSYGALRVLRAFRLLRIFRILKLSKFSSEMQLLAYSLKASSYKIMVFLLFVVLLMIFSGTLMYVVEGGKGGFSSIPASIYWAIVTTTTVGYGDITPITAVGKIIASVMMITGYAIIAVPTGMLTVQMSKMVDKDPEDNRCQKCGHDNPFASIYCNQCGSEMPNA